MPASGIHLRCLRRNPAPAPDGESEPVCGDDHRRRACRRDATGRGDAGGLRGRLRPARLGRHVLEVVVPDLVDAAEARRLEKLEAEARSQTRLTLRRLGDGTTRLLGRLPDASATRLATYLGAFANPRKAEQIDPGTTGDPFTRLPYPRRLGEALCKFLETIDPTRLPLHGGDATTVVVTVSLEALRAEVAAATLVGDGLVPGDDLAGDTISASDVRRLACNAEILPAVLGEQSEVLDLGRARRIFTSPQRKALLIRDRTCRAEGCDIPGTWSEAHHWVPWTSGGETDLATPSCSAVTTTIARTMRHTRSTGCPTGT